MEDREKPSDDVWSDRGPHEEFLELCALSTAGGLTPEEQTKLQEHLAKCSDCRDARKQFETVVDRAVPALASELEAENPPEDPSFSQEAAEGSFLKRLAEEDDKSRSRLGDAEAWLSPLVVRRSRSFRRNFDKYHFWLPLAAGLFLCISLGILTYRMGKHRGLDLAGQEHVPPAPGQPISQEDLATASKDRDSAH